MKDRRQRLRNAVHRRNRGRKEVCAYCGVEHPNLTLDHIIPTSKGGLPFNTRNVVLACERCNTRKGDAVGGWIPHYDANPDMRGASNFPFDPRKITVYCHGSDVGCTIADMARSRGGVSYYEYPCTNGSVTVRLDGM